MSQVIKEEKKKRGRKKQNVVLQVEPNNPIEETKNDSNTTPTTTPIQDDTKPPPKKRGRKPKGGKIIQQNNINITNMNTEPNVILHLKCSLKDISTVFEETFQYNPNVESIQSFNFNENNTVNYLENENTDNNILLSNISNNNQPKLYTENIDDEDDDVRTLWKKINSLKVKLHNNDISDKRSACFWCTCEFDNPPIYIPKCEFKETYQVYGCFCSPQCGVAYLMNEKMDSSVKFERYHLLNHVYGKIFNYEKNIKPAANPYYTLDKYYGNLSIKEYRELSKGNQLLIIAEKPLTHVFPELYEDNSDYVLNQRITPSSSYKLKRKTATVVKNTVLENFGINKN
jgi:hypothetical protein